MAGERARPRPRRPALVLVALAGRGRADERVRDRPRHGSLALRLRGRRRDRGAQPAPRALARSLRRALVRPAGAALVGPPPLERDRRRRARRRRIPGLAGGRRGRPGALARALPRAVGALRARRQEPFPAGLLVALAGGQRAPPRLCAPPARSRVRARLPARTADPGPQPGARAARSAHGMNALRTRMGSIRWPSATWPALGALALGLAVVLLRPPIPIDETRYLEVFHESLRGNPVLLRLLGEPYAEKPPLLFWVARLLTWLAGPRAGAMRCVPLIAAAAPVLIVGRLGQRLGLTLAGWCQAALWIGSLSTQFLHFDPLLTLSVWAAMDAWLRRSTTGFTLWSAAALLAKGPVAYLFLIPFAWSLAPLRERRPGDTARTALALVLALVPLAAWAITAATMGGEDFARALLWDRWAGRVAGETHHARGLFFYLPVVLVGSLPATALLFRRKGPLDEGVAREWSRRIGWSLVVILVLFTLISGKQAHYLEPAVPGLALWLAWRIESRPDELPRLRFGIRVHAALFLCLAVVLAVFLPRATTSVGTHGSDLIASGGFAWPLAITAGIALLALACTWVARLGARELLALGFLGVGLAALPLHWLGGELLFPHRLADALQSGPEKVAYLGSSHHGVYALLSPVPEVEKLRDAVEVSSWSLRNPESLVVADPKELGDQVPPGLVVVARDVVHRTPVLVLRRGRDS